MAKFNSRLLLCLAIIMLAGCSVQINNEATPTTAPFIKTATLPFSPTSRPSETALPMTITPTVAPVAGVTSTQLNVRVEPSTAGEVLGIIAANSTVQIIGRDTGGNWWQIIYETGESGTGWVSAQFVETGDSSQVPVIGSGGADPNAGNTAVVIEQINVRSGPGTSFDSIGILNVNDVVSLTGKNSDGTWFQIEFSPDPSGKGWVNSGFVNSDDVTGLPIVSDSGKFIGTGTPVDTPLPSTPTHVPASMDFDSADAPIKTVTLGQFTSVILYSGDVSSPNGDTEDWISVITQQDVIYARIECIGSTQIKIEIIEKGISLVCNETILAIPASPNIPFLLHVRSDGTNQFQYTKYTLEIRVSP